MPVKKVNAEDQVVHSALDQGSNRSLRPEVKGYVYRSLRALLLRLYVHVAWGLEGEHGRGLTIRTCIASQAAARMSVLIVDEHRSANSFVRAPDAVAARKCSGARLAPIETPVPAQLGAKASEPFTVALACSPITARLLFTPAEDACAESALKEERESISPPETHADRRKQTPD